MISRSLFPVGLPSVAASAGATSPAGTQVGQLIWSSTDSRVLAWDGAAWQPPVPKGMEFFCSGKPTASEVIGGGIAPYALTLTVANCTVKALAAATASTTIIIKKNGTQIGTAVFAASGTTATVTLTTTAVAKGDNVTLHAPASVDATLSDITGLLSE